MAVRDTSKEAFEKLTGDPESDRPGAKSRLRDLVFAAIVEHGPVHNLRLLEILQQIEKKKPKTDRIEWTRSNCWPRVTWLVANNHVKDLGAFCGTWNDHKKTLHFWAVSGQSKNIPPGWKKKKTKASPPPVPGVPEGSKQKYFFRYK